MYEITAAHKSLPIPTYVRVTRLDNGRSLVVKVTDRGPFKDNRIIDLSYAAAVKLGMAEQGTAPVEVVALEPFQYLPDHPGAGGQRLAATGNHKQPLAMPRRLTAVPTQASPSARLSTPTFSKPVATPNAYLQLGAFSERRNAEDLQNRLLHNLRQSIWVDNSTPMYKVRIGPLYDDDIITELTLQLADLGIQARKVVE
jgi:rare lipoprotein A